MTDAKIRPIHVLLVEDDPGDVRLTREALADSKVKVTLSVADDGEMAMEFLAAAEKKEDSLPDLIFLDLNLPKKNGQEVLAEIRQNPKLKKIPVIVLTTSQSGSDVVKSYELGANCYVTKPVGLEQFIEVVGSLEDFWLTIVRLPSMADD